MNTYDKVLKVAEEQVGYLEKASPYDLDSFTGNAGYNNYTKYARDLHDEIGSPFVDGYAWCQTFVTWCFVRAYGEEEALRLLGGWTAYCPTAVGQFKNMGEWHTSNPKKGDVIYFYDSDGDYGHVGLVYDVDSSKVYTIEGNTSATEGVVPNGGGVHKKSYDLFYYKIAGYGRPDYDEAKNGWEENKSHRWKYYIDGEPYKDGWLEVDNKWYYFSPNGYMLTDRYIKSADYATNGLMYYIDKKGVWNNRSYRWIRDSKGWMFQGVESGHLVKSKFLVIGVGKKDKKTYYVDSKGYCVMDKTITIKGKKYTFDADGALVE